MPQDVISELRRGYDELTQSQKRIAEAIVEDPEFVAFATVDKMAARLGVSPSTVVRFAYRIGLNGYQDLQDRVRVLVRSQMRSNVLPAGGEPGLTTHLGDSVFARSFDHDLEILRRTIVGLERRGPRSGGHDPRRGPPRLRRRRHDLAQRRLLRGPRPGPDAGRDPPPRRGPGLGRAAALDHRRGRAPRADLPAVRAGQPPDHQLGHAARARQVVAVTDTPISPVGQRVDVVLPTLVSGLSTQNSFVAAMAVVNALLNGVVAQSPEAMERYGRIMALLNEWDVFVLKGDDGSCTLGRRREPTEIPAASSDPCRRGHRCLRCVRRSSARRSRRRRGAGRAARRRSGPPPRAARRDARRQRERLRLVRQPQQARGRAGPRRRPRAATASWRSSPNPTCCWSRGGRARPMPWGSTTRP